MSRLISCTLLFLVAVLLELGAAAAGTIIANRTNRMGFGYIVLITCLAIPVVLGCSWDRRLEPLVRVVSLVLSLPVSLFLYEHYLIAILRALPLFK